MARKSRLATWVAMIAVVSVAVVGTATAASHHHRRHHRHHHPPTTTTTVPSTTTSTISSPPTGSGCTAQPNPVTLVTPGTFAATVQCNGLGNQQAVVFTSPSLALACTSVSLGGTGTSSASRTSDQNGRAVLTVQGAGCSPGAVSVLVSETAFSLTVPLVLAA